MLDSSNFGPYFPFFLASGLLLEPIVTKQMRKPMNQFTLLTIALLSILSGVGCHSFSGTSSTSSTVTVNGKSQEDYYAQFVNHDKLDCTNKTGVTFSDPNFYLKVAENPDGSSLISAFNLTLKNDSYILHHSTYSLDANIEKVEFPLKGVVTISYSGTVKIVNGQIYLENIGQGTGLIHNARPAINFTFDRDLSGQNLKDKSVLIFSEQRELTPEQVEAKCSK